MITLEDRVAQVKAEIARFESLGIDDTSRMLAEETKENLDILVSGKNLLLKNLKNPDKSEVVYLTDSYLTKLGTIGSMAICQIGQTMYNAYLGKMKLKISAKKLRERLKHDAPGLYSILVEEAGYVFAQQKPLRDSAAHRSNSYIITKIGDPENKPVIAEPEESTVTGKDLTLPKREGPSDNLVFCKYLIKENGSLAQGEDVIISPRNFEEIFRARRIANAINHSLSIGEDLSFLGSLYLIEINGERLPLQYKMESYTTSLMNFISDVYKQLNVHVSQRK